MQRYVEQLIEDLQEAAQKSPVAKVFTYTSTTKTEPIEVDNLEQLFDFVFEKFPAPELLEAEQMEEISEAILSLWKAYNLYTILPNELPPKDKYQLLISTWCERAVKYSPSDFYKIEFCNKTPQKCLFKSHCLCTETEEDVHKRYGLN